MITQHQTTCVDGGVLFRFTAGALAFDVLSTPAELEHCRSFLGDASTATVDRIRMGLFGPYEVLLIRGTDDWSVRVRVCTIIGDASGQEGQCISADMRRAVLLTALTQCLAPPDPADTRPVPVLQFSAEREALAETDTDRRVLHAAVDVRRLVTYVATHWTVPRIEVVIDEFSELERQRAQTRVAHLAGVSEYQSLGVWAVVVTVVLGTTRIIFSFNARTYEERFIDTYVTSVGLWEYGLGLVIAAGCAWFAGKWLGALWCRLRLLLALCRLWSRVRSLESTG